MVDVFFVSLNRCVDVVVGEVEQERLGLVTFFEEFARLLGEALREVFTIAIGLENRIVPRCVVAAGRRASMMPSDVDVEALIGWPLALVSQVPFAGEECLVAVFLERLGNGDLLKRKVAAICRVEQGIRRTVGLAGDPVGDIDPDRMPAGHDAGARRAADGTGRIAMREAHAAPGQAVDVGGLVKRAAIGPNVRPAHVVHKEEQEVGSLRLRMQSKRNYAEDNYFSGY